MKRLSAATLSLVLGLSSLPAFAQSRPDFIGDNPGFVAAAMQLARDNLGVARLPDGSAVPPETPAERAEPLVPPETGKLTLNAGMLSGYAQFCGLDWRRRSFLPFVEAQRAAAGRTEKQVAYLGILHGIAQGMMLDNLSRHGQCTPEMRQKAEAYLSGGG